jgi:hypothetical protein
MRRQFALNGDGAAGICVAVLGAIVIVVSQDIQGYGDDPVGPKFLPVAGASLLVLLGLWLAIASLAAPSTVDGGTGTGPGRFLRAVLPLGILGILYALALPIFGYLLPTLLTLPVVLLIFGIRSPMALARLTLVTTAAFYLLFFMLLGVYDPPGEWLDISGIFR